MIISMTKGVQEKIEQNKNLLTPMQNVISKFQRLEETSRNISVLNSDVSVMREGNLRIFFTKDRNNNVVILDIADKRNL